MTPEETAVSQHRISDRGVPFDWQVNDEESLEDKFVHFERVFAPKAFPLRGDFNDVRQGLFKQARDKCELEANTMSLDALKRAQERDMKSLLHRKFEDHIDSTGTGKMAKDKQVQDDYMLLDYVTQFRDIWLVIKDKSKRCTTINERSKDSRYIACILCNTSPYDSGSRVPKHPLIPKNKTGELSKSTMENIKHFTGIHTQGQWMMTQEVCRWALWKQFTHWHGICKWNLTI